jgi:hypothetical protein
MAPPRIGHKRQKRTGTGRHALAADRPDLVLMPNSLQTLPQHSLPGGSLSLTRTGLAPVGSRQLRLAHRVVTPMTDGVHPASAATPI